MLIGWLDLVGLVFVKIWFSMNTLYRGSRENLFLVLSLQIFLKCPSRSSGQDYFILDKVMSYYPSTLCTIWLVNLLISRQSCWYLNCTFLFICLFKTDMRKRWWFRKMNLDILTLIWQRNSIENIQKEKVAVQNALY